MKRGKFIVIDGIDGSGKATQTEILIKRLKKEGYKVKKADFPRYGKKSAGLVEEYLNGKYGKANDVGPYRASVFYACDRYVASLNIRKWLAEGYIVISNRYVTASMGHQGGKIANRKERIKFFRWIRNLEYGIFDIPKPDIAVILDVEAIVSWELTTKKGKRGYIEKGTKDIHEKDIEHLENARKSYKEVAKLISGCFLLECTKRGQIMKRAEIAKLVWEKVISIVK